MYISIFLCKNLKKVCLISIGLQEDWALLQFCGRQNIGTTWLAKRISLPISGALRACFFLFRPTAGLPTGLLLASGWGHLLFFPKTRSYFFKESMPHLKTVVGEDDGPLDQGPGEMCWAKKDERKIPSQNASAFFAPSSLLPRTWHFQWRGPQTCQGSFS